MKSWTGSSEGGKTVVIQATEYITTEKLDEYISEAARAAGYEKGFGITGCDLSLSVWWAAYCRQSLDQQSHNNRLPEYLLTLAKMAKEHGVAVPREYVFYDHESGEHLDRPRMIFIRKELIGKQKITGILFADLRCLSREPAPQQVFERVCEIMGVRLIFGDAPSGMDVGSQFARSALTFSNKLARLATNRNARAGNIGRVLKGWVPAHKAAYGYTYCRDAAITDGRIQIKRAWWEVDKPGEDGKPVPGSPADTVTNIFKWLGNENRSCFWAARKLNEVGIKGPSGGQWTGNLLRRVVLNHCYTGKSQYNARARVPNPKRPLGDVTEAVKRTLIRPKPAGEAVTYSVPALVSEELWQKANQSIKEWGRGRGKEGKCIEALLRNRIICPRCGRHMIVRRRKSWEDKVYYHCPRAHNVFSKEHCDYRRFVPGEWDESVWDVVYVLLRQNIWIEEHLSKVSHQGENGEKMIRLEQQKLQQIRTKISKIREGFEGGLYSPEEARAKVDAFLQTVAKAEREIKRLEESAGRNKTVNIDELRNELNKLAALNLDEATFEEKLDIVSKLNIKVYPSEDLKTMKIKCSLFKEDSNKSLPDGQDASECGIN